MEEKSLAEKVIEKSASEGLPQGKSERALLKEWREVRKKGDIENSIADLIAAYKERYGQSSCEK
jgi:hypothetical protein